MTIARRMPIIALALFAGACTDAATRVAYDIQSGAGKLGAREGERVEIRHVPSRWPEGCAGSYTLHIGKGSATAEGNNNFHINPGAEGLRSAASTPAATRTPGAPPTMRFVDVPETVNVEKQGGEAAVIEVERRAGRAVVVALH